MIGGATGVEIRNEQVVGRGAYRHSRVGRRLHVHAPATEPLLARATELVIEARPRQGGGKGLRLALEFVVAEEMDPVAANRSSERPAHLLIRVGKHALLNEV